MTRASPAADRPAGWQLWLSAARPRTLPAAIAPVLVGAALARLHEVHDLLAAGLCLVGAIAIQVGTNYANDYFDFRRGADDARVKGPARATSKDWVRPEAMRTAFLLAFGVALAVGVFIVLRGGWPFVAIGLAAIALGILYTGGPAPLGYVGLADPAVFLFFGPVAVAGTYALQAGTWPPLAWIAGVGPGALAVALLTVNNLRDVDTDTTVGKRTWAVRFGTTFARWQYTLCVLLAFLVPALLIHRGDVPPRVALCFLTLVFLFPALRTVWRAGPEDPLHGALAGTGQAMALYSGLFALGCLP